MKFKNPFSRKTAINSKNINEIFNFEDFDDCKRFLQNLYIGKSRVQEITLSNGNRVKMEDIPDDQVIQRAKELRSWIYGKPEAVKN